MTDKTSKQIIAMIKNGDACNYDLCLALIRECDDIRTLRCMLIDTVENAKNAEELSDDLLCNYLGY